MLKTRWLVLFAVAFALVLGPGAAGVVKADAQAKCPVLGGNIDKNVYVDYQGKRVYFCCKACVDEFNKDPEKYMKKMEAAGVTPEKAPAKK